MKPISILIFVALFVDCLAAQTVSTLVAPEAGISYEAISWNHNNGRVLIPDWTNGLLHEVDMEGNRTTLIEGIAGPLGGAWDAADNFYLSEYGTGSIIRLEPDGSHAVIASGLGKPAGLLVDSAQQILYIADYEKSMIRRLYLDDLSNDTLVAGNGLNGPDGIAYAPDGDLIVNNFNNNKIFKVTTDGDISLFSTLTSSQNSGYLVRRGQQYITAGFHSNRLWAIDEVGNVSIWAGSPTAGGVDGPLDTATFHQPNGIAISADGDSILVSDGLGGNRLRLITGLNEQPSTTNRQLAVQKLDFVVSPNPVEQQLNINFELQNAQSVSINLYDQQGRLIDSVVQQRGLHAGKHQFTWTVPHGIANGYYQCSLQVGQSITTKPVLVKRLK